MIEQADVWASFALLSLQNEIASAFPDYEDASGGDWLHSFCAFLTEEHAAVGFTVWSQIIERELGGPAGAETAQIDGTTVRRVWWGTLRLLQTDRGIGLWILAGSPLELAWGRSAMVGDPCAVVAEWRPEA